MLDPNSLCEAPWRDELPAGKCATHTSNTMLLANAYQDMRYGNKATKSSPRKKETSGRGVSKNHRSGPSHRKSRGGTKRDETSTIRVMKHQFKKSILFLQAKRDLDSVPKDNRAWESFVISVGGVPANAPRRLRETISLHKASNFINAGKPFLTRRRLESLYRKSGYWTPFRQLCLYSMCYGLHKEKRGTNLKYVMSENYWTALTQWLADALQIWDVLFQDLGREIALYTFFSWETLQLAPISSGSYAVSTSQASLCADPQTTSELEGYGFEVNGRGNGEHEVYRKVAKEFTSFLYNRLTFGFSGYEKFSDSPISTELGRTVRNLAKALGEARVGKLVDGHYYVDPLRMSVTRFSSQLATFIKQQCDIKKSINCMTRTEFNLWDSDEVALVGDALTSKEILNFEVASNNFELKPSGIEGAGRGLFKVGRVPAGTKIGSLYGIFIGEDISAIRSMGDNHTFGPVGYRLTKRYFEENAMCATEGDDQSKKQWIVPATFCPAAYINDYRTFENGRPTETNSRRANIKFDLRCNEGVGTCEGEGFHIDVITLLDIEDGDEILGDYGPEYKI